MTIGLVFAAMVTVAAPAAAEVVVDRIAAIVNNDIILQSEVDKAMAPYIKNIKERGLPEQTEETMLNRAHEDIFNNLISEKLVTQKAAELGIIADEKEVNAALEQMRTSKLYSDEAFQSFLKESGYTMDEYRDQIKSQILKTKLLRLEIKSKTVVTPEEVETYFQNSRDEFTAGTQYHLRHIIMQAPKGANPEDKAAVREKMEEVHRKIEEGAPFESMAEQYSQSSFASSGGDIGTFAENDLAADLKETIIRTGEGKITPVMETDVGYQIFYVQSIIKNDGSLNNEVAEKIHEKLYNEKLDEKFSAWIKELRDSADIKSFE
ncbi:MAG: peptidylprolyl isomerase [Thermodesulfobacteriota bacterium]